MFVFNMMKMSGQALTLGLVALILGACSGESGRSDQKASTGETMAVAAAGDVGGKIEGTQVQLTGAEFDGDLALYEGDGWGWNPSVLIFLFLDNGEIPENRTFEIQPSDGLEMSNPHIHYRWRNEQSGDIDVDMTMKGYDMKLSFGTMEAGVLPGTIEFGVPGEETRVAGNFRAKVKR
jgi:hypothetical protein